MILVDIVFTIIFEIYAGIIIGTSPIFIIPWWGLRLLKCRKAADWYMKHLSRFWSWLIIRGWLIRLKVNGLENIPPKSDPICFISNHQSFADIPLLTLAIPLLVGFVSKKELDKVFYVKIWKKGLRNVSLDRTSPRDSIKAILKGVENIKNGHPMLIFPEGTRSKCNGIRAFKKGSFKLATKPEAKIVPITLDGAFKLFQHKRNIAKPFQKVTITIHPPIDTRDLSKDELEQIHETVWDIVNSGLENPNKEVMPPKPIK